MKVRKKQSGLSLMEMAVIIGTIALLVGLGLPAIRALVRSLETEGGTRSVISAALSSARTIALREQKYAGVRFQKAYRPEGPLDAPQYMIFVIYDAKIPNGQTGNLGCRAVKGLKPIKLSDTVGIIDYNHIQDKIDNDPGWELSSDPAELTDLTTFTILFSPSGKLMIHKLWVLNRDGEKDSSSTDSYDDIFNKDKVVESYGAMFYQDDYTLLGFGIEDSRNSFIIYETGEFKKAYLNGQAWSGYLSGLEPFYINAYMGTIIERD